MHGNLWLLNMPLKLDMVTFTVHPLFMKILHILFFFLWACHLTYSMCCLQNTLLYFLLLEKHMKNFKSPFICSGVNDTDMKFHIFRKLSKGSTSLESQSNQRYPVTKYRITYRNLLLQRKQVYVCLQFLLDIHIPEYVLFFYLWLLVIFVSVSNDMVSWSSLYSLIYNTYIFPTIV